MTQAKCLSTSLLLLLLVFSASANNRKPVVEKQPQWVLPVTIPYNDHSLDDEAEDGYLDLHFEKQVSLAQQAVYVRQSLRVLSESGVENLSQVSVNYQSTYQQVAFHNIRIIRDGQSIDKLDLSKLKVIQQESELDRSIYDGSLTAVLILEDLRKDDILEYSYTIKGFNPVFQNRYTNIFLTKFNVPIYSLFYRLIVPTGRKVQVKSSLTDLSPTTTSSATETVYEWHQQNQSAIQEEENIPSWHDIYPAVLISEFTNWSDVNNWALQLYSFQQPLSKGLQEKINEIKQKFSNEEDRLLATIRFVQDDIRYMGIELGENSHRPHSPSEVFQQRFGDCKDKAYLLCTMLRTMGYEAYPVLISTNYKKTIADWLPSPTSFNHVTTMVVLHGKKYWFDPTISYQRGRLNDISFPDYQIGLVVKAGTTDLETIPLQNNGTIKTKEQFYIDDLDGSKVKLVVTTHFTGSFADNVRYAFKSNSKKEMLKNYQELYTAYFKKLTADSIAYQDVELSGQFTTKEYYTIHDLWKTEDGKQKVSFEPYLINSIMKKPDALQRNMPFELSYPARYEEEIEIHLPDDWKIDEASDIYNLPGCSFSYSYSLPTPTMVLLHYKFETKDDHVKPSDVPEYLRLMESAEKNLAFQLTYGSDIPSASTKLSTTTDGVFRSLYVILGLCFLGTYFYKRNRKREPWA